MADYIGRLTGGRDCGARLTFGDVAAALGHLKGGGAIGKVVLGVADA